MIQFICNYLWDCIYLFSS